MLLLEAITKFVFHVMTKMHQRRSNRPQWRHPRFEQLESLQMLNGDWSLTAATGDWATVAWNKPAGNTESYPGQNMYDDKVSFVNTSGNMSLDSLVVTTDDWSLDGAFIDMDLHMSQVTADVLWMDQGSSELAIADTDYTDGSGLTINSAAVGNAAEISAITVTNSSLHVNNDMRFGVAGGKGVFTNRDTAFVTIDGKLIIAGSNNVGEGSSAFLTNSSLTVGGVFQIGDNNIQGNNKAYLTGETATVGSVNMVGVQGTTPELRLIGSTLTTSGGVSIDGGKMNIEAGSRLDSPGSATVQSIVKGGSNVVVDLSTWVVGGTKAKPGLIVTTDSSLKGRSLVEGEIQNQAVTQIRTIDGSIENSGTYYVYHEDGATTGENTVTGDLTEDGEGVIALTANSTQDRDTIQVGGVATIAGTLTVSGAGVFSPNDQITVIHADGGLQGSNGALPAFVNMPNDVLLDNTSAAVTGGLLPALGNPHWAWKVHYGDHDVTLTVVQKPQISISNMDFDAFGHNAEFAVNLN
jgi:hypothetical protein